MDRQNDPA